VIAPTYDVDVDVEVEFGGVTASLLLSTYDAGPGAYDFKNAFQMISFGISLKVHV
jgi:hypothetical protein